MRQNVAVVNTPLKQFAVIFFCAICAISARAQSPQKINYQAIARNTQTGVELGSISVFVIVKVLAGGPNGSIIYQEEHADVNTNRFGLFSIQIGGGDATQGIFGQINWSGASYWLEIEIDAGNGLESAGSMQFVSVPYALHAETATFVDDADADPNNEKITDFSLSDDGTISITESGMVRSISLTTINVNDADSDPQNELIGNFNYDPVSATLSLAEGQNFWSHDLSGLANAPDADADPENELVHNFLIDEDSLILKQSGLGQTFRVALTDLAPYDLDGDPQNELVQSFSFNSGNYMLSLGQPGPNNFNVNLSALKNDADADPQNELLQTVAFDSLNRELKLTHKDGTSVSGFLIGLDDDPENELVQGLNFNPSNNILTLGQAGADPMVDLSPLIANANAASSWIHDSGEDIVYNLGHDIGIGTATPNAKLEVKGDAGLEILRLADASDNTVFSAEQGRIGLGGQTGLSTIQMRGSVGFNAKVLTNGQTYTLTDRDYLIVGKFTSTSSPDITLNMPDPISCKGRMIRIKRINLASGSPKIVLNFSGALFEFQPTSTASISNSIFFESVTLMSLGADGWVIL